MRQIAQWICDVVRRPSDDTLTASIRQEVRRLCANFPVPGC
jgi:glycine hydroxymethyltransferase